MNVHYDDRPPGVFRGTGYWVDQAWYSYLNDLRLAHKATIRVVEKHRAEKNGHIKFKHYQLGEVCTECRFAPPKVLGKCFRCYKREYMRAYYRQRHRVEATTATA